MLGSAADGTYRPGLSDLDLLVLVDGPVGPLAPPEGVDLGVLSVEEAARGGDGVNALRVLAARRRSIASLGPPAVEALAPARAVEVGRAAAADLRRILAAELTAERWPSGVLGAFRDLATMAAPLDAPNGKEEAAACAPAGFEPLAAAALAARRGGDRTVDEAELDRFRSYVAGRLQP
jgi:hypothetical protein